MNRISTNDTRNTFFLVGSIALLIAYALLNLIAIYLIGPYAWDDGAITLAYSKTLSENGVFALTKQSEIVEGTSSLLLAFLMAALHSIFSFTFNDFIGASQVFSFFALSGTLFLVYRYIQRAIPEVSKRILVVILLGSLPMFVAENLNGMEMTLFALLLTAIVIAYEARSLWLISLVPLLLLVRFEAIFYMCFSFGSLFLTNSTERRRAFLWGGYAITCFLIISLIRWTYFGDVLPNTIWAKMNPPYSVSTDLFSKFSAKIDGLIEFLNVQTFLIFATLLALPIRKSWAERLDLKLLLIISFGIFALITGKNWGYDGRMFVASVPLFLLVVADSFKGAPVSDVHLSAKYGAIKISLETTVIAFWIVMFALWGTHAGKFYLTKENLRLVAIGGYHQHRLPSSLLDYLKSQKVIMQESLHDTYDVTPYNFKITGTAVDEIRSALGLRSISFMVPDVGGLGLCCPNIRVIDSALLTNRFLAKNGYAKFEPYLKETLPDVIETHEPWSRLSDIYRSEFFKASYEPIVFQNILLWIRKDNLSLLLQSPRLASKKLDDFFLLDGVRNYRDEIDVELFRNFRQRYLWVFMV